MWRVKGARIRSRSESDNPCRLSRISDIDDRRQSLRKLSLNLPYGDLSSILCSLSLNDSKHSSSTCSKDDSQQSYPRLEIFVDLALRSLQQGERDLFCKLLEQALAVGDRNYVGAFYDQDLCVGLLASHYRSSCYDMASTSDTITPEIIAQNVEIFQRKLNRFIVSEPGANGLSQRFRRSMSETDRNSIVTTAERAVIAFKGRNYEQSLADLKKILAVNPRYCGAELRMAIGHCHTKLRSRNKALLAYQRALDLDNDCLGALVGIAYCYLIEDDDDSLDKAWHFISKAHHLDPSDSVVSELLNNGHQEPDFFPSLLLFLRNIAAGKHGVADMLFCTAKTLQGAKLLEKAARYYSLALEFGGTDYILPQCGLGQIYLEQNDVNKAIRCFETIYAQYKHPSVMKILVGLYRKSKLPENERKAQDCLQTILDQSPDFDTLIQLAEIYESRDNELSLHYYKQALDVCQNRDKVPINMYVNLSALCTTMGNFTESEQYLILAKELLSGNFVEELSDCNAITMILKFNEAVLYQRMGRLYDAACCYETALSSLLLEYDCYLQLGRIAVQEGNPEEAREWFNAASAIEPDKLSAQIFCAQTYLTEQNFVEAGALLDELFKNPLSKTDTYFLLEYGNYYLALLQEEGNVPKDRKVFAEKAFALFRQVLVIDPSNVYAVNGLASVLSKTGFARAASEMLAVVVKDCPNTVDFLINMGHSYCEQREYLKAVESYRKARMASIDSSLNPDLLLLTARAFCLDKNWTEASGMLQLLCHLNPECTLAQYNLAIVHKHFAVGLLKDKASSFADVCKAIDWLKYSQNKLKLLLVQNDLDKLVSGFQINRALESCKDYVNQSGGHLTKALEVELECRSSDIVHPKTMSLPNILTTDPIGEDSPWQLHGALHDLPTFDSGKSKNNEINKKRSSGFAKLDSPFSEENEEILNIAPEAEVEPQRKRHRAVDVLTRRQRKVADRKRRELEIEKCTISSDEENVAALRQSRRKAGRTEEYGISFRRDRNTFRRPRSPVLLQRPVTTGAAPPSAPVKANFEKLTVSTEEEISTSSMVISSKQVSSDTPPSDDNSRRQKSGKVLRSRVVGNQNQRALTTVDKRPLPPESDDKLKRFISECEDSSRKRLSTA
ncbi:RNA polymerase-associated protein CTR9 homolog [Paramacrobiotus metropolitanus]|uniref:RNA polymerase-associated protein CTR9 homolog n=1 Tax=Paramacrobiotus metropolitanus TaxID=2943436 RepID=UPI0024461568|nr:RNA polymerase-associated protein CTR9 homolog [Paramacrobiotus metropolitanus]